MRCACQDDFLSRPENQADSTDSTAKYYLEARINSGDRIIFRIEDGSVFFIDVVAHDDIGRYGKRRGAH